MASYRELSRKALSDGFLKVDSVTFEHRLFSGEMSAPVTREIVWRPDAAAGLIHETDTDMLVFVEQFRAPTAAGGDGVLLELVAGILDEGETPEQTFIRETKEEAGYHLTSTTPIADVYSSPGGLTEKIHLFFSETLSTDRREAGGGLDEEQEDIRVVRMPVAEVRRRMEARKIMDAKTLIVLQWFFARKD